MTPHIKGVYRSLLSNLHYRLCGLSIRERVKYATNKVKVRGYITLPSEYFIYRFGINWGKE